MNLEEFYAQIGGDYADTLQRLCNENMVKKFVKKYQDDPTCADLHNAVLQQDWEAAFRGAHTLKGVAQNLGFERLYQVSAVLTEAMRGNKPLEDRSLLDAVEQQDAAIRRAISEREYKQRTNRLVRPFETVEKLRFPNSLSLETTLSSETEEKPRPTGTFFLPLYKFRDTCSRNL